MPIGDPPQPNFGCDYSSRHDPFVSRCKHDKSGRGGQVYLDLTLGGAHSAVIGLALKDPVSEIIAGTSVLLSDKFATDEVIRLGGGATGQVQDFQWTNISVRGRHDSFAFLMRSLQISSLRICPEHQTQQCCSGFNKNTCRGHEGDSSKLSKAHLR